MTHLTRLRWVRAGGLYDLLVSWPLLTPWTLAWMAEHLNQVNGALGWPGAAASPDALHGMLAGMAGCLVMLWGWARWRHPSVWLGQVDAWTRVVFGAHLAWAAFSGLPRVLLLYALVEVVFAWVQWTGWDSFRAGTMQSAGRQAA